MGRLIPLFFLVNLTLVVIALIDCLSSDDGVIRALPRVVWVFVILLFPPVGPVAWFIAGRPVAATSGTGLGRLASKRIQRRPLAPDDDPEFLASLAKRKKDDETLLQMWEADLRRREEELRRETNGTANAPQDGDVSTERDQPTPPVDGDDRPGSPS